MLNESSNNNNQAGTDVELEDFASRGERRSSSAKAIAAKNASASQADIHYSTTTIEVPIVLVKAVLGEFLCTFLFIFIVCSTVVNFGRMNTITNPVIGAVSTAFSAVALIYSFADVSGANFNPAVTFATWITGKVSISKFLLYVGAQLLGSILAAVMLLIAFPGVDSVPYVVVKKGADVSLYEAFIMELILTFILVYVIFATAFDSVEHEVPQTVELDQDLETGSTTGGQVAAKPKLTIYTTSGNTKGGFAPIAIGFTLGFLCFIGGTVSGGCFNPARAFGPALIGQDWSDQWLYWVADFCGAGLAGYVQMIFAHNKPDPLVFVRPILTMFRHMGQKR